MYAVAAVVPTEPLQPSNTKIFAHIRTYEEDVMLCVHNLARSAQPVELDLSAYQGDSNMQTVAPTCPPIKDTPTWRSSAARGSRASASSLTCSRSHRAVSIGSNW